MDDQRMRYVVESSGLTVATVQDRCAAFIAGMLENGFSGSSMGYQLALNLAEESGEAVGAARRYMGLARRQGTKGELGEEVADAVIAATALGHWFALDVTYEVEQKLEKIFKRGWRE